MDHEVVASLAEDLVADMDAVLGLCVPGLRPVHGPILKFGGRCRNRGSTRDFVASDVR
jgi:hypothetical protein